MVSASDLKVYKQDAEGGTSGALVPSATPNQIFTNVPKNELTIGEDYYAGIWFKNTNSNENMDNFKLWLSNKSFPQDTVLKWAIDPSVEVEVPYLSFDGSNDYVDCTNDATLWSQSLTKFSFSFWIYPTAAWDGNDRFVVRHTGSVAQSFHCYINDPTSGTITFQIRNAANTPIEASSTALVKNKWNFITCVYDNSLGSANLKIYVDAVVGATTANLTEAINLSNNLRLGDDTTDFKGYMKDFRWWTTKALSQQEITDIFNDNSTTEPDYRLPMQEGTGNPVDEISGTKVGTLSGTAWIVQGRMQTTADKYTAPINVTWKEVESKPILPNGGTLKPSEGFPVWLWLHVNANAEARLDDNALFSFEFNIPQGGTGTGGGSSGGTPGTYHYEPYGIFRTQNFIQVTHEAAFNLNHMTVALWFRTSKDYTDDLAGYMLVKGSFFDDVPEDNINYTMLISCDAGGDNRLEFNWENTAGDEHFVISDDEVNDGQWHLGVGTWDGSNTKVYVDGVLHSSTNHAGDTPNNNDWTINIGQYYSSFATYEGDIDEVRIWNVALTQSEISDLFESGEVPQTGAIVYENLFGGSGGGSSGGGTGGNPPPTPTDFKIAVAGDWGCEPETDDVIDLIQSEDYDYVVGVGDNAYESASCWITRFTPLKPNFNSAYGNHEYSETGGTTPYKTFFGHSLTYFTFKYQNFQFFVIDTNINCDVGSAQHTFIKNALEASQNDNTVTWRCAVLHNPMWGADSEHAYNEANTRENFSALFVTNHVNFVCCGHNHNWQRTHQIRGTTSTPTVADNSSPYSRSAEGFIHIISGTGGHDSGGSLYSLGTQPSYQAYQNRTHNGVWEIVASNTGNTLTCSFVDINGDKFDTFTITA
jgi:hypothetical protein